MILKNRKVLFIILFLLASTKAFARVEDSTNTKENKNLSQKSIQFLWNPKSPFPEMGMKEDALNLGSLYKLLDYAVDEVVAPLNVRGALWRIPKFFLWDFSNVIFLGVCAHELGHGIRAKELGATDCSYILKYTYVPFLLWEKGKTSWCEWQGAKIKSYEEELRMDVGGMEADNVLGDVICNQLYSSKQNDEIEVLSGFNELGTLQYILRGNVGDVASWLDGWNHQHSNIEGTPLARIRREALLFAFLDPTHWQWAYYIGYKYLLKGEESFKLSMIKINRLEIMPGISYGLTSEGTEEYYNIFWRLGEKSGKLYWRYRWNPLFNSSANNANGIGFLMENIALPGKGWHIGFNSDVSWGEQHSVCSELELEKELKRSNFSVSVGGKNKGYLRGEPYESSLWIRFGIGTILF